MGDTGIMPQVIRIEDRPYRIRGQLGCGSFSRVFDAVDRSGRSLALKLPRSEIADAVRYLHRDRDARLLLHRHHGPLAQYGIDDLVDHGTVREPGHLHGLPALLLPQHAATVADVFGQADPFPEIRRFLRTPAGFLRLCRTSFTAVAAIEAVGMRHCDIKLGNMAVIPRRTDHRLYDIDSRLLDFGGAKWIENIDASVGVGTPSYMPPEARWLGLGGKDEDSGRPHPLTDDMFALGSALYGILMGSLPHRQRIGLPPVPGRDDVLEPEEAQRLAAACAAITSRLQPAGASHADAGDALCGLILRCLSVDRQRRPAAVEALSSLDRFADDDHDAETILCAGFRADMAGDRAEPPRPAARESIVPAKAPKPRRRMRLPALFGLLLAGWTGYAIAREHWAVPIALPPEALRYSSGLPGGIPRPLCAAVDGVPGLPVGAVLTLRVEFGPGFPLGDTLHPLAVDVTGPGPTLAHQPTAPGGRCADDAPQVRAGGDGGRTLWCPSLRLEPTPQRHTVAVAVARGEPLRQRRLAERLDAVNGQPDAVARVLAEEANGSAQITLQTRPPSAACPL